MVPPLRYKGKFITQKRYEMKMKMLKHMAEMQRLRKEKRAAESNEEPAAAASPPRSPTPSPPISSKTAAKEEKSKTETSNKRRGKKRKATPVKSGPASKRSAIDKQNIENSPQQANVSSVSSKSDEE